MRKQGLFFLLSAAMIGLTFLLPIAQVADLKVFPFFTWELGVLTVASGVTPLILAFLQSKRDAQVRFGAALAAIQLGLLGYVIYYFVKALNLGGTIGFGAIMPLIALILNILAIRAVIDDMKIIRKSNRIR